MSDVTCSSQEHNSGYNQTKLSKLARFCNAVCVILWPSKGVGSDTRAPLGPPRCRAVSQDES